MNRTTVSTTRTRGRLGIRGGVLLALGAAVIGVATPVAVAGAARSKCQPAAPYVHVHNTYAWASWGTWAMPGQRVAYAIELANYSCSAATITADVVVPEGFAVEPVSPSVSLRSGERAFVTVYVTSPTDVAVIDHAVVVTAWATTRSGFVEGNTETSYYKVYTSDAEAPTSALQSHSTGGTVSGTVQLTHSFRDDHMARRVELYIDGSPVTSSTNEGITPELAADYMWDTRSLSKGEHTVEWWTCDDFDNALVDTWVLTVQ